MKEQGNPRYSIENRIILAFDRSPNSEARLFKANKELLINALIAIANDPYRFTYWLEEFEHWVAIKVFSQEDYEIPEGCQDYYEHSVGLGYREPDKGEFSKAIILEVAPLCDYKIKPWRVNPKAIGIDGELKIDLAKLRIPKYIKQLNLFSEVKAK